MTIEPAYGAFMIKSVFLSERLVEIKRLVTYVRSRKSFVQTIQLAVLGSIVKVKLDGKVITIECL
jgi:hypothetical protein